MPDPELLAAYGVAAITLGLLTGIAALVLYIRERLADRPEQNTASRIELVEGSVEIR